MIVVDTNVIGYLYLTSERSVQAEQAFLKDQRWAAPLLWRSEFRNVLAICLRRKVLTLETARQIMNEAMDLMSGREYEVVSSHVLHLVAQSTCSAYDCEFVALAQDLGVPLVTVDRQVLAQFPDIALELGSYAAGKGR
ncbi:MAG: type II toxin-antitoxin system VapC family toxin [Anaerolineae bacterium]|nr:type II toxin-antitoxin system VapC family toxin [Anaerolineae bacterium]